MKTSLSRRGFLAALAGSAATPIWASGVPFVIPRLRPDGPDMLIAAEGLRGHTICAVADARTGEILEQVDGDQALPPASVAKALTAIYALKTLGPEHRFATRVLARGKLTDGVLEGDLILAGGGDPVLDTDDLAALAAAVKAAGLREVRGRFVVWDGALPYVSTIDSGQPAHVGYSPAIAGLALNFNRVHFEWVRKAGEYTITMDARTEKFRPDVTTSLMTIEERGAPVYLYQHKARQDRWSVARSALGDDGARWLPVRNPGAYAADVFRTLARSHGLVLPSAVPESAVPDGRELARVESRPLSEILRAMLKYSNNLTAEMVGMAATTRAQGRPASLGASARAMSHWAQAVLGMRGVALVDHSGLGGQSRMSPAALAVGLSRPGVVEGLAPLLKTFPLRDAKGRTIRAHPVSVAAKTGTLNFVSGLGGYVTTPGGRALSFAVFSADLATRNRLLPGERERPPGGRGWNRRSKWLQQHLIERWARVYDV